MGDYEVARQAASDTLSDMEHEIAVLNRAYRNYVKHDAVNAAAELKELIDGKTQELDAENCVFGMAFN